MSEITTETVREIPSRGAQREGSASRGAAAGARAARGGGAGSIRRKDLNPRQKSELINRIGLQSTGPTFGESQPRDVHGRWRRW